MPPKASPPTPCTAWPPDRNPGSSCTPCSPADGPPTMCICRSSGDGDPHTVIRPNTVTPRTPTKILQQILARDDAPTSATTQLRQLSDPAVRLHTTVQRYTNGLRVTRRTTHRTPHRGRARPPRRPTRARPRRRASLANPTYRPHRPRSPDRPASLGPPPPSRARARPQHRR